MIGIAYRRGWGMGEERAGDTCDLRDESDESDGSDESHDSKLV